MGMIKKSQTFKTQVTPDRMFKALILDSHNFSPQLKLSSITSIDCLRGNGDVGSIKQMNFNEDSPLKYVRHRIDMLDKENFICKYTVIDANALIEKLESASYEIKFEKHGYGGCLCKMSCEYKTKENVELKDEDIEFGKDRVIGMYQAVESYLLAHPRAYT